MMDERERESGRMGAFCRNFNLSDVIDVEEEKDSTYVLISMCSKYTHRVTLTLKMHIKFFLCFDK
jgi:hypothetical protein